MKKLYKFMLASGMVFTVAGPVVAAPSFSGHYPGHYWVPANVLAEAPRYHFRPLPQPAYPAAPRDFRFTQQQRIAAPVYPGQYRMPPRPVAPAAMATYQPWQERAMAMRPLPRTASTYPRAAINQQPAFVRQFGWPQNIPASRHSFGENVNRYANQESVTSPAIAMTTIPARVTAAQYRYRPDERRSNVRRIQFTDTFRTTGMMSPAAYQWQNPSAVKRVQAFQADNNPYQMRQAFLARQQSWNPQQQYRFRPDPRFKTENRAVQSEHKDVLPVSYKLANNYNPEVKTRAANPWKQWSFRPVDTTF